MTRIFVDTNILFADPFFQVSNKYLLELADRPEIEILLSDIVVKEILVIVKGELKDLINQYKINQSKLRKLSRLPLASLNIERSLIVEDLQSYFNNLQSKKKIKILSVTPDVLDLSLKDLLDKKAPFFNEKNELKDSIIWYTYANYANENDAKNCILLTDNIKDFGNNKGEIHQYLSEFNENFKLIRSIPDLKIELGEIIPLTDIQKSSNTLAEAKIKNIFQKEQVEVLIDHLNDIINEYYKFRDFDTFLQARSRRLIQVADFELLSLSVQRGNNTGNLYDFYGTITANLKLEIYDTNSKRIANGSRINLVEIYIKPFLFDFEVILNEKDYIEYLVISNLSEIQDDSTSEDFESPF